MPAPVRRTVLPASGVEVGLCPSADRGGEEVEAAGTRGLEDDDGKHGFRKSTSAATAALVVVAPTGNIVAEGRGSVYGTRSKGALGGI